MGTDDFGKRMNSIHKYVVSSTLSDADASWGPTTVLRGDVPEAIRALREKEGGIALVEGSAQLVQTLAQHDLVDGYRLMVFPVILGSGKRLFRGEMPAPGKLQLTSAQSVGKGVLTLTLQRP